MSGSSSLELTGHFEYDQNQNAVILEQAQSGHREQKKDELRVCPIWDSFPALPLTKGVALGILLRNLSTEEDHSKTMRIVTGGLVLCG